MSSNVGPADIISRIAMTRANAASTPTPDAVTSVFSRLGDVTAQSGDYTEAQISFTDITTNDVSTSKHGYVPKAPNDTTKFLRGDATWAAVTGGDFTLVAADELTADNAASMDFQSISTSYDGFLIFYYLVCDGSTPGAITRLNNDSAANYGNMDINGNGTAAASGTAGGTNTGLYLAGSSGSGEIITGHILIMKPIASLRAKGSGNGGSDTLMYVTHSEWNNTADKISRITVLPTTGNFDTGSTVLIFGFQTS